MTQTDSTTAKELHMPNEQPEPKEYPIKAQYGSCPFKVAGWEHTPERTSVHQAPCDPFDCALGIKGTKECCIKDAARSLGALYTWNCDATAGQTILRQLIKEISNRLGAILQSAQDFKQPLPGLEKRLRESLISEGLAPIAQALSAIANRLDRICVPAKSDEPT